MTKSLVEANATLYDTSEWYTYKAQEEVQTAVCSVAAQLVHDGEFGDGSLYIANLMGGEFFANLVREEVGAQSGTPPPELEFIRTSRYGNGTKGGITRLVGGLPLREVVAGMKLVTFDDLVEEGKSLEFAHDQLWTLNPRSIRSAVLLRKRMAGQVHTPDYVGMEIDEVWVAGCGMNDGERYRDLPFVIAKRS